MQEIKKAALISFFITAQVFLTQSHKDTKKSFKTRCKTKKRILMSFFVCFVPSCEYMVLRFCVVTFIYIILSAHAGFMAA